MGIRIGIPSPTSMDFEYNRVCWPQYAGAVRRAGGEAVEIALTGKEGERHRLMRTLDGFVLPGSPADVSPSRYGEVAAGRTAAADPAREECDWDLLEWSAASGRPVLAICFGMQFMNVWRGGTLVQDLAPVPVNHSAGPQVAVAHGVLVEQESLLAGLLTGAEAPVARESQRRLAVNSSHHQAIGMPAREFAVVARSVEDSVIEAVEGRVGKAAMLGVQWHPERSTEISAASRALFIWLVSEAEDRRGSLTLEGFDGAGQ